MATLCAKLGDGRRVTLASYLATIRAAKANPEARFARGLRDRWPCTGAEILADWRAAAADRVNRHRPHYGHGRKWEWTWQRDAQRVASNLAGRVITMARDCPPELRNRLAHRLYSPEDF